MHKVCGPAGGKLWGIVGRAPGLYPTLPTPLLGLVGINSRLRTLFTHSSTAVTHSQFSLFTTVVAAVSPTFHTTNKDNNKVYIHNYI